MKTPARLQSSAALMSRARPLRRSGRTDPCFSFIDVSLVPLNYLASFWRRKRAHRAWLSHKDVMESSPKPLLGSFTSTSTADKMEPILANRRNVIEHPGTH